MIQLIELNEIRVPAQFTGSFETYTNRLCWLQNTYYVDQNTDIPDELEERHKSMLKCKLRI
jgi:hypothetical protein